MRTFDLGAVLTTVVLTVVFFMALFGSAVQCGLAVPPGAA